MIYYPISCHVAPFSVELIITLEIISYYRITLSIHIYVYMYINLNIIYHLVESMANSSVRTSKVEIERILREGSSDCESDDGQHHQKYSFPLLQTLRKLSEETGKGGVEDLLKDKRQSLIGFLQKSCEIAGVQCIRNDCKPFEGLRNDIFELCKMAGGALLDTRYHNLHQNVSIKTPISAQLKKSTKVPNLNESFSEKLRTLTKRIGLENTTTLHWSDSVIIDGFHCGCNVTLAYTVLRKILKLNFHFEELVRTSQTSEQDETGSSSANISQTEDSNFIRLSAVRQSIKMKKQTKSKLGTNPTDIINVLYMLSDYPLREKLMNGLLLSGSAHSIDIIYYRWLVMF